MINITNRKKNKIVLLSIPALYDDCESDRHFFASYYCIYQKLFVPLRRISKHRSIMKRTILLLIVIASALVLTGCLKSGRVCDFDYYYSSWNTIKFTSTSKGMSIGSWEFGDGESYYGSSSTVTHTYAKKGKYQVRLTCADTFDFTPYYCTKWIEIK